MKKTIPIIVALLLTSSMCYADMNYVVPLTDTKYSDRATKYNANDLENNTHVIGDGSDHADVATNTIHRSLTDNPHGVTAVQAGAVPTTGGTFLGNLNVGSSADSTNARAFQVGNGRTSNGSSYIDLIGDTTYSDYGLRIIRKNNGENSASELTHKGTGALILNSYEAGSVEIKTDNTTRATVDSDGITLSSGTNINEFSIDGTLAGDSDNAVPTEKAVKAYVDANGGGLSNLVEDTTPQLGGNLDIQAHSIEGVDATEFSYVDGVTSDIQTQINAKEGTLANSAGLLSALSDETGTGVAVFGTTPTIATPVITGKVDRNNVAVNDDDCTGEQGAWWYDTTDSAFEFCNDNSGTPVVLGGGSGGYTNLTEFVEQTAWRVFYSDTDGDVTELALGADGTYLKSNGATSAPTFATPSGSGDVSKVGTPADNQVTVWTGDGTAEGTSGLTYDGSDFGVTGNIVVSGTVDTVDIAALASANTGDQDAVDVDITDAGSLITATEVEAALQENRTAINLNTAKTIVPDGTDINDILQWDGTDWFASGQIEGLINDTAGNGDVNEIWSANKIYDELQLIDNGWNCTEQSGAPSSVVNGACVLDTDTNKMYIGFPSGVINLPPGGWVAN